VRTFCSVQTRVETFATDKRIEREKEISIHIESCVLSYTLIAHMDRRLHAVQDRLVEHCTQTFKSVQGSMSAVTTVS
jgi:hypothetical protein